MNNKLFLQILMKMIVVFLGTILFLPASASEISDNCYINFYIKPIDNDIALAHCEKRFNEGDARSGYWLGVFYNDQGDYERGADYYKKSAQMGDAWSLLIIGYDTFSKGLANGNKDLDKGLEQIKKSADLGWGKAQFTYAHIYDRVRGVERDTDIAWDYYNRAADSGNEMAMVKVASFYLYGNFRGERKIENCQRPSGYTHPRGKLSARDSYAWLPIKCDEEKGLQYLKNAAAIGSTHAMLVLWQYYRDEKPDEIQETYWLLRMSMWKHPLPNFEVIIEKTNSLSQKASSERSESRRKELVKDGLLKKSERIIEKAKLMHKVSENESAFICSFSNFSWYYICKGEEL